MKAEVEVRTTVTVDLGHFTTHDLIEELQSRGHAVDVDAAGELDTKDLLEDGYRLYCRKRGYYNLGPANQPRVFDVPLDRLIQALKFFGCPQDLVERLLKWDRQPAVRGLHSGFYLWVTEVGIGHFTCRIEMARHG